MKAHAWEYGFVMSYPKGKIDVTCYDFEPWHFRYVGRELAAQIHASGLTPREYLWANFTTTVVPATDPQAEPHRAPTETAAADGRAIGRAVRRAASLPSPPTAAALTPPPTEPAAHRRPRPDAPAAPSRPARPAASPPSSLRRRRARRRRSAALAVALVVLCGMVLRRGPVRGRTVGPETLRRAVPSMPL